MKAPSRFEELAVSRRKLQEENEQLQTRLKECEQGWQHANKQLHDQYRTLESYRIKSIGLESRLQEAEGLLSESQEHFQYGLEFGVTTDPRSWMQRRDAFLNPKTKSDL